MSDPFAEIRPYRDDEVNQTIARLLDDPEFLDAIASLRSGWAARLPSALVRPLVRHRLRREVRGVSDVYSMQMVIKGYMDPQEFRENWKERGYRDSLASGFGELKALVYAAAFDLAELAAIP